MEKGSPKQKNKKSKKTSNKSKSPDFARKQFLRQAIGVIDMWLKRKRSHLYSPQNSKVLTVMVLSNFMGYSFREIRDIYQELYNFPFHQNEYEMISKNLETVYLQMMEDFKHTNRLPTLSRCRKHPIENLNGNTTEECLRNDQYSENHADWYSCNSVDAMDGSKYIGYHRREYQQSRFGSFPVHDDYSDESWADDNPWE
ncbi:hypothetical protein H6G52_17815 [Limnothrix sp. FACHB-881]|uniref:hypothetical protein n=1 Tax=Limnothrix sp. FACHB-881 TaxID=2692819 RepID=UPI001689BA81|nr:hypothetical protein [Limnothrix sp. FACHB-881]MBD2637231.1 hypothetical protein [Limnothrix sp. FACHB-881]